MVTIHDRLAGALRRHQAGDLIGARSLYDGVLAEDADQATALYLYGLLHLQAGRPAAAAALLARSAAVRPAHAGTAAALGAARLQTGDLTGALAAAEAALRLVPKHPRAWFILGTAQRQLGLTDAAISSLRNAVETDPSHADAWLNLGNALLDLDHLVGAETNCRAALALAPELAEAHASLGHVLCCQGRYREAITACEAAIALHPDFAVAHWNQGIAHLLAGDFIAGWEKYEWRKRHPSFAQDFPRRATREWRGEAMSGRTLLVTAEQGFGDTIQFARYLPMLAALGFDVVLECAEPLVPLLGGLARCVVKNHAGRAIEHDVWVDQMSLPGLFDTTIESIPSAAGYIMPDPLKSAAWRRRLPAGRLIGLVWAGNPAHSNDRGRSLPRGAYRHLQAPEGARFVSLQCGPRRDEAGDVAGLIDVAGELTDFAETAAVLACLDLVITVDTAVAHLAGALGRPTWLLLPFAPDWRWLPSRRDDSPWYASVQPLRQSHPGEWATPLRRVAAALASGALSPA
jgi:tetratricopeptide (TPR) repeat protein